VFASRIPLSKRVMSSILVLAATQSVAHAQNLATVTVSPTTVDEGQPITISMTIDVSILNQLGAVQTDGPATCTLEPSLSAFGNITLSETSTDVLSGSAQVSTAGISPGTYTATCKASYIVTVDIDGTKSEQTGTVDGTSNSFVINGTGSCSGTEGTASVQAPPAGSGDNDPTYAAAITLPYTTAPGSSSSYSTSAEGVSDTSPYWDCDGDTIYATATPPTVTNGAVQPNSNGPGTVTFNWAITPIAWPSSDGLTYCDCTDCSSGTCDSSGIDNPSTVTPQKLQLVNFAKTAECTSN
jgi:hypothetical protein